MQALARVLALPGEAVRLRARFWAVQAVRQIAA
jgi:hypothetical protein